MKNNKKKLSWGLFLILVLSASPIYAGGDVANGGDIFEFDQNHSEVFDKIEYEIPFMPSLHPETREVFETFIAPQIAILKEKLPRTGVFLEALWGSQGPLWYFVKAQLKERNDEGNSNIVLKWNKKQVAVYHAGIIQINYDMFKQLPNTKDNEIPSIAYLLSHELFWDAVTNNHLSTVNGEAIRRLSGIFLNPYLSEMTGPAIARHMLEGLNGKSSLAQILRIDLARQNSLSSTFLKDKKFKEFGFTLEESHTNALATCNEYLNSFSTETTVFEFPIAADEKTKVRLSGMSTYEDVTKTYEVYPATYECKLGFEGWYADLRENLFIREAQIGIKITYNKIRTDTTTETRYLYRRSNNDGGL